MATQAATTISAAYRYILIKFTFEHKEGGVVDGRQQLQPGIDHPASLGRHIWGQIATIR
jgi:hypothetical protein